MQKITSRENQKLKHARRVRDRRAEDLIFIEGLRLAEEALRSGIEIEEVFFAGNFQKGERAADLLQQFAVRNVSLNEVSEKLFDALADTKNSQGIILICRRPATSQAEFESALARKKSRLKIVLLLHQINNPSNLGAILRSTEAADAAGVITTGNSADIFSPKSLRASMGAGLRLPIWENASFEEVLRWSRGKNLIPTAADVNAEKSYTEIDWRAERLLIFGSEAHGLSAEERGKIDELLMIPMENEVESLNLAVSSGVILFEAKRQNSLYLFEK